MRYRKIAVAAGFSPTLPALLAQAGRLARATGAQLILIHAADEEPAKAAAFAEVLEQLNQPPAAVWWSPGTTPVEGILKAVNASGADLLIAGALEREPEHRAFLGSVARGIMNDLCCDKLLLTQPRLEPPETLKLAIAMEPRGQERGHLTVAEELCAILPFQDVVVAGTDSPLSAASGFHPRQVVEAAAAELRKKLPIAVDSHCVQSNTGFALCDYIQGSGPDLLVVAATLENGRYVLPRHLSWLNQVIPCNTLIVRG